jgi:hypothetical protein
MMLRNMKLRPVRICSILNRRLKKFAVFRF